MLPELGDRKSPGKELDLSLHGGLEWNPGIETRANRRFDPIC
jgi:hypothetical protein